MTTAADPGLAVLGADGVLLTLDLAGPGSRALAGALDLPHAALPVALAVDAVWLLAGRDLPFGLGVLGACAGASVVYGVLCEQLASGQTVGARAARLRVVDAAGRPPLLLASVVRNLLRLLDALPALYAVAVVATVLGGGRRLGDVAAGTWVVRQRPAPPPRTTATGLPVEAALPDVRLSGVTADERSLLVAFLSRRGGLTPAVRAALAGQLADVLRPRLAEPSDLPPEVLLEAAAQRLTSG